MAVVHDNWKTDPKFYKKWDDIHHFDFDPFPWDHDMSWNGLTVEWGQRNFVNCPYSLKIKTAAVLKGIEEMKKGKFSFFLLPVSTSTALYHDIILPNCTEPPEMVKGRIPFIGLDSDGRRVNYHLIGEETDLKQQGKKDNMIVRFDGRACSQTPVFPHDEIMQALHNANLSLTSAGRQVAALNYTNKRLRDLVGPMQKTRDRVKGMLKMFLSVEFSVREKLISAGIREEADALLALIRMEEKKEYFRESKEDPNKRRNIRKKLKRGN